MFSRWMHKYLPPRPPGKTEVLRGKLLVDKNDLKPVKVTRQLQDWQIKCVCGGVHKTCNNGWMRFEIEDKARPILIPLMKGESFRISPTQQHKLAAWIALKCMISEFDVGSYVTTHHSQRKRMLRTHKPPEKGWGIWIGNCNRENPRPAWSSMAFSVKPNPKKNLDLNKPPTHYNSHASTQVINKLFIQVIRMPEFGFISTWHFKLPDGGVLFRIWPPAQFSINWPARALSDKETRLVADAFEHHIMGIARKRTVKGNTPSIK